MTDPPVSDPGSRGGRVVAPHMPRLDWQMWFAALTGDCGACRRRTEAGTFCPTLTLRDGQIKVVGDAP